MIVGIAGLGPRGRAIGARLRAFGMRVAGFDYDVALAASSGLRTAGSIDKLAGECQLVLVTYDGERAEATLRALLSSPRSLSAVALCGCLDPRRLHELVDVAAGGGVSLLDTPIDGGDDAVQTGRATVFAGGDQGAIDECRPVFEALGSVMQVGPPGSGQITRAVNDLLHCAAVVAIAEAFRLVRACGADSPAVRDAVLNASGASRALADSIQPGRLLALPDLQPALLLAHETGASMPLLERLEALSEAVSPDEIAALSQAGIADLSRRPSLVQAEVSAAPPAD